MYDVLPAPALYARIDVVSIADRWHVMEVEATEPALWLDLAPDTTRLLADAIARRLSPNNVDRRLASPGMVALSAVGAGALLGLLIGLGLSVYVALLDARKRADGLRTRAQYRGSLVAVPPCSRCSAPCWQPGSRSSEVAIVTLPGCLSSTARSTSIRPSSRPSP